MENNIVKIKNIGNEADVPIPIIIAIQIKKTDEHDNWKNERKQKNRSYILS